ncbi:hypothetical protein BC829DRAFT_186272 [Chytridium lagenaria]|nr:hypothetical protein BC829DRAFT_186272 [Chytridium lagenaria]
MNAGKAVVRGVKNYAKGYSEIQVKVRNATSNDPGPPQQADMMQIARATFNHRDFIDIMEMLDKRLNDKGKNWRHVYKSLILLDYLLHEGSENVIKYAKENLYVVKTLKDFQYVDDDSKDHGMNVRQLSKDITALLADDSRLQTERRDPGTRRSNEIPAALYDRAPAREYYNEETDLEKALEESRKTARMEERKRTDAQKSETDLQKALELSEKEAVVEERKRESVAKPKQNDMIDFFASTEEEQPNLLANSYQQSNFNATPFGGFSGPSGFSNAAPDPFVALMQQQQMQQQQLQQQIAQQQLQQSLFSAPAPQAASNPFAGFGATQPGFPSSPSSNSISNGFGNTQTSGAFFDNVPRKITPQATETNFNGLNDVARNSQQIDPFASLANSSRSNGISTGFTVNSIGSNAINPFAPASNAEPFGNSNTSNDLFAMQNTMPLSNISSTPTPTMSNSPSFQQFGSAGASKNPFQPAPKFQWEANQQATPSLAQLATTQNSSFSTSQYGQMGQSVPSVSVGMNGQNNGMGLFGQGQQQAQPFGGLPRTSSLDLQHPSSPLDRMPLDSQLSNNNLSSNRRVLVPFQVLNKV